MQRSEKILKALQGKADALLVKHPPNVRYASGFTGEGWLLIGENARVIFTDGRFLQEAAKCKDWQSVITTGKEEAVAKTIIEHKLSKVGIEEDAFSIGSYLALQKACGDKISLLPLGGIVENARICKDDHEIAIIAKACALTCDAFWDIIRVVVPGMTEIEVADRLWQILRQAGADAPSFPFIIAGGENGSQPHAVPSQRQLQKGDLLTLDYGIVLDGYCSDFTRTVAIGSPSVELRRLYDCVSKAQELSLKGLCAGRTGKQVDAIARDYLAQQGYTDAFCHGLGHGMGIEIHEAPRLSTGGDLPLENGMIVTVEPGLYIEGLGGVRIEDSCLVLQDGYRNLTQVTKELLVI